MHHYLFSEKYIWESSAIFPVLIINISGRTKTPKLLKNCFILSFPLFSSSLPLLDAVEHCVVAPYEVVVKTA